MSSPESRAPNPEPTPDLLALDIALLLPLAASERAVGASAALPSHDFQGLRLNAEYLPHITLVQQFARVVDLEVIFEWVSTALREIPPMPIRVTGGGQGSSAVWMAVDRTPALSGLHERLMQALRPFERPGGGPAAFFDRDARTGDVAWVTGYRQASSLSAYTPHITLGHAATPPHVEPFTFEAPTVAACHLGRFCSCRRVLRRWELD